MPTPVQLKRNGTPGASAPSSLLHGELALNYADKVLYFKDASNVIQSFTFQSYALASHTHAASDITSGTLDAARLPLATTGAAGAVIVGTGLGVSTGTVSVTYGTSSTSACRGDDSRLSDTRTPTDGSVTTAKIANDAVTYAKIQNVSATNRLLGRSSAGAGDVEEITCTSFGRSLIDDADAEAARTTLSVQPTAGPVFTSGITVTQASAAPTVVLRNTTADATEKAAQVVGAHYTATEETIQGIGIYSTATENVVAIGGGSALSNAASEVRLYTAANTTTTIGTTRLTISSTGTATFAGQIVGQAGAAISGGAVTVTSPLRLTGTVAGNNRMLEWQTSGTTRWQVSAHFNAESGSNAGSDLYVSRWSDSGVFLGTPLQIRRDTGMVTCESGLTVQNSPVTVIGGSVSACSVAASGDPNTGLYFPAANVAAVVTDGVERLRVDASGNVLVGQSTTADPAGANTNGIALAPDYISVSRSSFECLRLNIKAADGTIVALFQDAALEGSISVAGNTVSYNAFCGSHWAQLSDQSRPAILRGTVMETIDEMCDWPEDGGSSDRLVRVKVSDTPASRRVYGVFLGWDGQYASTGDMYVAGLGAYMVRVSGVVQSGDLLESAGDGTARTQADDIVRSTTIGKASSTHRIAEYDDGSYLVPCVLMCG
jgi:hypothetical protein